MGRQDLGGADTDSAGETSSIGDTGTMKSVARVEEAGESTPGGQKLHSTRHSTRDSTDRTRRTAAP